MTEISTNASFDRVSAYASLCIHLEIEDFRAPHMISVDQPKSLDDCAAATSALAVKRDLLAAYMGFARSANGNFFAVI